jgi:PelA/Pel-15E family pectate lyase
MRQLAQNALVLFTLVAAIGSSAIADAQAISWQRAQRQGTEWFTTKEGRRVVDNVLLYQFPSGGWPKNIDMAAPLSASQKRNLSRRREEATIDNGGTYTQLRFLARVYEATHDERVRDAFSKGLDYLFAAQYDNGGWPIYYPLRGGYDNHIHFNDNSVSGVLMLLDDVAGAKSPFGFVDPERRDRASSAFDRGIECILKCQVLVNGRRTVWCAQHDESTLAPASARAFEPVSLSGHESVDLVRCLMRVDNPTPEIVAAVESAVDWFHATAIEGLRVQRKMTPQGGDVIITKDPDAPPLWARFYEIGTNRPIFAGRSAVVHYSYDKVERERRVNYAYYGTWPQKLLSKDYPPWATKWHVEKR